MFLSVIIFCIGISASYAGGITVSICRIVSYIACIIGAVGISRTVSISCIGSVSCAVCIGCIGGVSCIGCIVSIAYFVCFICIIGIPTGIGIAGVSYAVVCISYICLICVISYIAHCWPPDNLE
jgi:hypothetical protein